MTTVPFEHIRDVSLAQADMLLREWFPRGRRIGREFKIGNIQGDPGESLSINVDTGRWADFAADQSGYDLIDLFAVMRHGRDRTAAALELGGLLGIAVNGHDHRGPSHQGRSKQADEWKPIVPPPADAPKPADKQLRCDMLHEYCSADDRVLCYVRRIEAKGSKGKLFLPLTFGTLNGKLGWHDKAPDAPKPLYRLNALSHAPAAPVLLCEGEKAADAAQRLFPDYVGVSWMGGARADASADLALLNGRTVFIWPDADQVGRDAAARLAERLPGAHIIDTANLPDGFDAADLERLDASPFVWLASRLPPPKTDAPRILTGAAFISRHVPPVWLIDGIIQRSRLYACTSLTGHGKTAVWLFNACMIHAGRMIGQLEAYRGNVLILAGENPSDLEARMIGMAEAFKLPRDQLPYVLSGGFPLNEQEAEALQRDIAGLRVPLALIVGDTASSFFPGDDENNNVQAGGYARTLRGFTDHCEGKPAVVALCHPVKNAARNNLLPRGGGAFLNELDGNTTIWSESRGEVTELHWQGKIRGPDFSPFGYRLRPVPTGLFDEKKREEMTIIAEPMSDEAVADHAKQSLANEDVVLRSLRDHPGRSWAQIARDAGWVDAAGTPEKWLVQRALQSLAADKLIQRPRSGAPWELTDKGEKALGKDNQ
jgi:AAA domain